MPLYMPAMPSPPPPQQCVRTLNMEIFLLYLNHSFDVLPLPLLSSIDKEHL